MQTKARLSIEYPWGHTITKSMTPEQRLDMLRSSVTIIRSTHTLYADDDMADWLWFFRGFVQWHALAIVVAELAHSTSPRFAKSAWLVLEPLLAFWDKVYQTKHGDAPWDHVNSLIQRSKEMARQSEQAQILGRVPSLGISRAPETDRGHLSARFEHRSTASPKPDHVAHEPLTTSMAYTDPPVPNLGADSSGHVIHNSIKVPESTLDPYFGLGAASMCDSGLAGFDVDMSNFDFFPESMDLDALNAVFTSQDWYMAQPVGTFDLDAVY